MQFSARGITNQTVPAMYSILNPLKLILPSEVKLINTYWSHESYVSWYESLRLDTKLIAQEVPTSSRSYLMRKWTKIIWQRYLLENSTMKLFFTNLGIPIFNFYILNAYGHSCSITDLDCPWAIGSVGIIVWIIWGLYVSFTWRFNNQRFITTASAVRTYR